MGSQPWDTHYVPPDLKENLAELFPDLTIEEALQHQESLYRSLQISSVIQTSSSDNGQTSSQSNSLEESYLSGSGEFDLAYDEALARSLQDLNVEDEDDHAAITVPVENSPRNTENDTPGTSASGANQDEIDPDGMTYEELQSLGEALGTESKGLSESELFNLPTFKYKAGFFSKKLEIGECVICCESYKNRQSVTSLPCLHHYHTDCINRWLRESKVVARLNLASLSEFESSCHQSCNFVPGKVEINR